MKKWTLALIAVCGLQFTQVEGAAAYNTYEPQEANTIEAYDAVEMHEGELFDFDMENYDTNYDAWISPRVDVGLVYVCTARGWRGRLFKAKASSKRMAERRALRRCHEFGGRRCHIVKCKRQLDVDL